MIDEVRPFTTSTYLVSFRMQQQPVECVNEQAEK